MYGGTLGQISNQATWENGFEIIDAATDDYMDLAGAVITLKVKRNGNVYLTGSTTTGELTIPALGQVDFRFEASQMTGLEAGTYTVGVTVVRSGDTDQLFLGTVAIFEAP